MQRSMTEDRDPSGGTAHSPDWFSGFERRLRAQEDEVTLLKSSLADALRRIHFYDGEIPLLKRQLLRASIGIPGGLHLSDGSSDGSQGEGNLPPSSSQACPGRTLLLEDSTPQCRKGELEVFSVSCGSDLGAPTLTDTGTQTDESTLLHLKRTRVLVYQPACTAGQHTDGHPAFENTPSQENTAEAPLSMADTCPGGPWIPRESTAAPCPIVEPGFNLPRSIVEDSHSSGGSSRDASYCQSPPASPNSLEERQGTPNSGEGEIQRDDIEEASPQLRDGPGSPAESPRSTDEQFGASPLLADKESQRSGQAFPDPALQALKSGKKELIRRSMSSDKPAKEGPDKARLKLTKKAASSANLFNRSSSLESRAKELAALNAGSSGSRRGNYNLEGMSIKMFLRGRPITMYIPSNIQNYEELRMELPTERLQLDWVYGYRGRDSRSNLYVLASGEVVYFIACVVVLYHVQERTQRHYLRHTDCVRCLAVHPDKVRVATGQTAGVDKDGKPQQPFVHIWDSGTLLTLQQIGLGHFERGVGSLAFSWADHGAYLCVVDDSNEHMLSVWDCARGTKQAEIKSTNESVLTVEFNPQDSSNIISSGKSHVFFWSWSGSVLAKKQGIFGKYKKPKFMHCFVFNLSGDVLTGDSEGTILTWGKSAADIKTLGKGAKETFQIVKQTKAHEGSIFSLCLLRSGSVLSGGGKDRKIIQWSPTLTVEREIEIPERFGAVRAMAEGTGTELLVGTTRNALLRGSFAEGFTPIIQGHTDELWGLATHPSQDLFLTCGHDRLVCGWDGSGHCLAWSCSLEETGLCADFHPCGKVVAVGLNTGRWVVLDTETQVVVADYTDGNEQLSVVRYSPDGNFVAIGSHDNFIYIYTVGETERKYSRFGKCSGHSSFITHLDWSKDSKFIMSNSGDYEILYWDVAGGCKLLRNRFDSRDREWATYTCVLGFHVFGVWPDGSDGTDINSLCRSHNERTVAVADDFCKVHLFQYPCAKPKAPSHVYSGHGSHVTNVRFTHDDRHLISMGGKDTSIFQWRVRGSDLRYSQSASTSSLDVTHGP
ncbi:echinoderm microtubule-associated protein-like 3 isoform X2 [Ambystoma mexicanum]|uniref:echinoderm microtubule-associated protein-like 3 isoform X2 n=1 Tax=Ambystoma mexicanum TaxID=8296 RepID=UPI0037E82B4F